MNFPFTRFCAGLVLVALCCFAEGGAIGQDFPGQTLKETFVWTGQPESQQPKGACIGFRKSFKLASTNPPVTLHIFADTRYLLWVNGRYVERGPSRFEPQAPEFDALDLTPFLQQGDNLIAVMVASRISNGKTRLHPPGLTLAVAQKGQVICRTDASWKWSDQTRYRPLRTDWANVYDTLDARVEAGDWTQPNYDDAQWSNAQPVAQPQWGELTASRIPRLREVPVTPAWATNVGWPLTLHGGQGTSFKFSRMVLAYAEVAVEAEAGSEFELAYLPENAMNRKSKTQNSFICRAGRQTFLTTDTHAIYEGRIRVKSGHVTFQSVKFVERLYPFERLGSFASSDPMLNKLWTTCVRGLEVVSEDAYVDCTDRERVEWMDCDPPAFDVTRVAMAGPGANGEKIYSDPRLLEVLLRRTAGTMQRDGWVKAHTASDRFDIHAKMEDRACDWVQGARRYYESCGKTEVIREIWPMIVRQLNYFLDRRSPRGLIVAREWVVWGNPVGYQTCEATALNAFIYRALADAAFLGNLIGEKSSAEKFKQAAGELARAINAVLWNQSAGTYYGGYYDLEIAKRAPDFRPLRLNVENNLIEPTRHAALFALDQGVVPPDRAAGVQKYLATHPPVENDIMQYYYYFKFQYGLDDPAQDLAVLNKLRTEWKDMAYSPFEATFEGLHSRGSQAHCYGMFPAYFLSSYVLGVRWDGPVQNKTLLIEPRLGDLSEASGTVITELGPVAVAWKRSATGGEYAVDTSKLKSGVKVRLHLPGPNKTGAKTSQAQGRWVETTLERKENSGIWTR